MGSTENSPAAIGAAIDWLANDGFIGYPTETVWGLGACADRPLAVDRLLAWKGRGADQPLAVLVASAEDAFALDCELDDRVKKMMRTFWPGPLTIVVSSRQRFAKGVARDDGALGLRCSSHPVAHALATALKRAGLGPLTSTSLNRSGAMPAQDRRDALQMTNDAVDVKIRSPLLVDTQNRDAGGAIPSSVVDCTGDLPEILRVGAIDSDILESSWSS